MFTQINCFSPRRADALAPRENDEQIVQFNLLESLRLVEVDFFFFYRFASRPPFPVDVLVGFQLACCTAASLVKTVVRPNQLFFSLGAGVPVIELALRVLAMILAPMRRCAVIGVAR